MLLPTFVDVDSWSPCHDENPNPLCLGLTPNPCLWTPPKSLAPKMYPPPQLSVFEFSPSVVQPHPVWLKLAASTARIVEFVSTPSQPQSIFIAGFSARRFAAPQTDKEKCTWDHHFRRVSPRRPPLTGPRIVVVVPPAGSRPADEWCARVNGPLASGSRVSAGGSIVAPTSGLNQS